MERDPQQFVGLEEVRVILYDNQDGSGYMNHVSHFDPSFNLNREISFVTPLQILSTPKAITHSEQSLGLVSGECEECVGVEGRVSKMLGEVKEGSGGEGESLGGKIGKDGEALGNVGDLLGTINGRNGVVGIIGGT